MPRFGTDVAQPLGEGLSGLAEVQAGSYAGQAAREKIERDLSLAKERLATERGWLDLQREISAKPTYHAPTKMEQDLGFLSIVGGIDKDGNLTQEGKRYMGMWTPPTTKTQIIQHPGMVPYAVEETTDPNTGQVKVKRTDIPGATMIPKSGTGSENKPDSYEKWRKDFESAMGREPTEDEKKRKLIPGYAGEQKATNVPLSGSSRTMMEKIDTSIGFGRELLKRIDTSILSNPKFKGAPTPDAAWKIYDKQSTGQKLADTIRAKAAAFKYFGGHIPDEYSNVITQAEQFTLQAVPQLTGSRAARYNETARRHLPDTPAGDPIFFLREKLLTALRNLSDERDSVIRASRAPISNYMTTDDLPSGDIVPHDGQIHTFTTPATGNKPARNVSVKWDDVLKQVVQVQ